MDPDSFIPGPKVFYANHTSHLDFAVIWSALPSVERDRVRPVAGRDYWMKNRARRYVSSEIFKALLIERQHVTRKNNPMEAMAVALEAGSSLIVFPEGTRGTRSKPVDFKPGLFHLHRDCPEIPLIPVHLQNLNRMMPKGAFLPIPLITHITFGVPVPDLPETKEAFLDKTLTALTQLNPI